MRRRLTRGALMVAAIGSLLALTVVPATGLANVQDGSPIQATLTVQSPGALVTKGVAVDIEVEIQCLPQVELEYLEIEVAQRFGRDVVRGWGYISYDDLPDCLGFVSQTATVRIDAHDTPFKNGAALVTARLYAYGDYGFFSIMDEREIRLKKVR